MTSSEPNVLMLQVLQTMQQQMAQDKAKSEVQSQMMAQQMEAQSKQMEAIAEKIGGSPEVHNAGGGGGGNKARAKGCPPEKLDRNVDYASFLQWEKSWNIYVISDKLDTLDDKQKTAILFSLFTNELLSDVEYRFKIYVIAVEKVDDALML